MTLPRIFVQLASYRDRECQWTVQDMFQKARHPERVFAGICWQTLPEEDADCFLIEPPRPAQVRELRFHIDETLGLGWARAQAQTLWQGEEYVLQIDSHMRFIADWDQVMLDMLAQCDSPDPVLTVYPPRYLPPDRLFDPDAPPIQNLQGFIPSGLLKFSVGYAPEGAPDRPFPTAAVAGGFIFGSSRIIQDVPSDPEIFFNGEEPNLAVRLWTHGFDLFSPQRPVIYHYYLRYENVRPWNDQNTWQPRHKATLHRMRALCEPGRCTPEEVAALGRFGLGTRRSLADYERFSGANFAGHTLADFARHYPFVASGPNHAPAPADDLWPEVGTTLFVLGDAGILFAEGRGQFYRLNALGAFVWCAREDGRSWEEIARERAQASGETLDAARADIADLAAHWRGQGLLRGPEAAPPTLRLSHPAPRIDPDMFDFRTRSYALLGAEIRIRYGDRQTEHWVHAPIAHLEAAPRSPVDGKAPPALTVVRIGSHVFILSENHTLYCGVSAVALAPRIKFHLSQIAIGKQRHMLQLHAGAVAFGDELVLLPAARGSGKTTLTAALVAAGAAYFSDEIVLIERGTDRVRPVPVSLCIKEGSVAVLQRHYPGVAELPVHEREDDLEVRYLPPRPDRIAAEALPPRLVIFPKYGEGERLSLRPLAPADALGLLMAECVAIPDALTTSDAATLVRAAESWRAYEMIFGELDEAVSAVTGLCRHGDPAAAAIPTMVSA